MNGSIITQSAIAERQNWIAEIERLSGDFGADTTRLTSILTDEVLCRDGESLRNHLRLCGAIPEKYPHDSSEEKLYSKYTDVLLKLAFEAMGMRSLVLNERADAADVECWADDYAFVADAKAFRLSRTAKNQKDFKVQAMHGWKQHREHAMVVCPLYQLPSRVSQIYKQAISHDICLFSFSHLSLLTAFADATSGESARSVLRSIFKVVNTLHPTKDANSYWRAINQTLLGRAPIIAELWRAEKIAAEESLQSAKEEGLRFLALERSKIMKMDHREALAALIEAHNLDSRERTISALTNNGLMEAV